MLVLSRSKSIDFKLNLQNDLSRAFSIVYNKLIPVNGTPAWGYRCCWTSGMAENNKQPNDPSTSSKSVPGAEGSDLHCSRRRGICTNLSGVQNERSQTKKQSKESINASQCPQAGQPLPYYTNFNPVPVQYGSNNTYPAQMQYIPVLPGQGIAYQSYLPYHHNFACQDSISNYSQALLQQNLSYACFRRPESSNSGNQANRNNYKGSHQNLRVWETLSPKQEMGFQFSVMSYNVLAQDLVNQHPHLYNLHNRNFLTWNFRWRNILNEIKQSYPDIMCLQEVQGSHVSSFYSQLEDIGYKGLYKQRTGIRTDGCAIYYKPKLFKLVDHTTVEYYQPRVPLLDRDNVAIIAKFAPVKQPWAEFVVSTTHLLYNPKRQDVRLAQTQLLLTEVERIAFKDKNSYTPIIVTGDLNSNPQSALYEFITNSQLKYEHLSAKSLEVVQSNSPRSQTGKVFLPPRLKITDQCQHAELLEARENNASLPREEQLKLIVIKHSERRDSTDSRNDRKEYDRNLFASGTLSHKFALKSVYDHGSSENPEGTTFQDEWLTVDYIFYSNTNELSLLERYKIPTKDELGSTVIPNETLGSDHLCLMAKFNLKV